MTALYIHWPFCATKCPYCDFNVHLRGELDEGAFADALVAELRFYADLVPRAPVTSIFFGGGTPSLMPPQTTARVIDESVRLFTLVDDCEISLEANPSFAETDKLQAFKDAGVNRLSIGIQSLNDADLRALGRAHTADEGMLAIERAATLFDNYSFDLIYARPDQTEQNWESELTRALAFGAPHLSLYQLTIEQGTRFSTLRDTGRMTLPDEDTAIALYDVTQRLTADAGLRAYEISNHARDGYQCRHNLNYWRGGDYIGVGPGAHGRLHLPDGRFVATVGHRAPSVWMQRVQQTGSGAHPFEDMDALRSAEEKLIFGLRLIDGIDMFVSEHLNTQAVADLQRDGFLQVRADRLVPTLRGRMVLGAITDRLILP